MRGRRTHVVGLLAPLLAAAPLLVACGGEPAHDYSDEGTVVGATDTPSGTPSDKQSDKQSAGLATVAKSSLTDEQARLYEDMVLFEQTARAKVGGGWGGSFGRFTEPGDSHGMQKPAGIQVADDHTIGWQDGELRSYALTTVSKERMTFEDGKIYLDVAFEKAQDPALGRVAQQLTAAVDSWRTRHGFRPLVEAVGGGLELRHDSSAGNDERVKVSLPDGLTLDEFARMNDEYRVGVLSAATQERALLTQDGLAFVRALEVV